MARIEGNILMLSMGLTIIISALLTAVTDLVVPSLLILGISVFTVLYSLSDLWVEDKFNSNKGIRFKYFINVFLKLFSMPLAFIVIIFTMQNNPSEATLSQANNTYTLLALGIFFVSIVVRSQKEPEALELKDKEIQEVE